MTIVISQFERASTTAAVDFIRISNRERHLAERFRNHVRFIQFFFRFYRFRFKTAPAMQYHHKSTGNGNRNNSSGPTTGGGTTSNKMFDLKMCLLDFMRITTSNSTKQKKQQQQQLLQQQQAALALRESSTRYGTAYMQKMTDANVIYFNENMSMTSKCNTIKFSRCPTGNFKPNVLDLGFSSTPAAAMPPPPLPPLLTNRNRSLRHWVGGKGALPALKSDSMLGIDSMTCFECSSSDERLASNTPKSSSSSSDSPSSDSSLRDTETDEYVGNFSDYTGTHLGAHSGNATALDSFCTLCTSSFSFNRCNRCEASSCSSKCNSAERPKKSKPKMTEMEDAVTDGAVSNNGPEGSGSMSGGSGVTSDYDSMQFR